MTSTGRRRTWPLRDYPSVFWLVAAVVVAISHRWVPSSNWLLVHLVLLGARRHPLGGWGFHFCEAAPKAPPAGAKTTNDPKQKVQADYDPAAETVK